MPTVPTSDAPKSAPLRPIFSNDTPPPEPARSLSGTVGTGSLGVLAIVAPYIVYLMVFPPAPGHHGTAMGAPGFAVLASGIGPGVGAIVFGVRALIRRVGSRVMPVFGVATGSLGVLWASFLWFVAFFVGY